MRLLFTDYDEFVALPAPGATLQDVIARHRSPIVYLTSHFAFHPALNAAGNESAAWRAAAAGAGRGRGAPARGPAAAAAAARAAAGMLQLLDSYSLRAGPSNAKTNPLGQVKALVDPNFVDQVGSAAFRLGCC